MVADLKRLCKQFARDGFVVLEELWSAQVTDEVECELGRFVRNVVPGMAREDKVFISGWDGPLKNLGSMQGYDAYFQSLPMREELRKIASALLGDQAISSGVEYFNRSPGSNAVAPYHQDNAYFCYEPADALAFWIPLDDVTEANGGVVYAVGSHATGLLPHQASGLHGFSQGMVYPEKQLAAFREVKIEIPRGGCAIHHVLTAHRSGPNSTDAHRRVMVLNYKTARAVEDLVLKERQKRDVNELLKSIDGKE